MFFIPVLMISLSHLQISKNEQITLDVPRLNEESGDTRQFIRTFIEKVNSSDWDTKIGEHLNGNPEEFIQRHKVFRKAFTKYHLTVKHLVVEGNKGVMWGKVSAVHSREFDGIDTKGHPATHRQISWEEVWYFEVEGNRFGENFDFMLNTMQRMKALGIKCYPE